MIAEHIDPEDSTCIPLKHYYMMQGRKIFPAHWVILSVDGTSLGNVFAEILRAPGSFTPVTESRFIHALVNKLYCIRLGRNLKAEIYGGTSYKLRQAVNTWPDIEKLRALDGTVLDYLMREIDNRTLVMEFDINFVTPHGPFRTLEGYYHYLRTQGRTEIGRMASNFYARPGE
ncbi:hypothetical protein SPFM20_00045 [Salmonella phage SPFM20]|nr:hypothetical protein SPFM20_00045 [Salmonella phage SPFM20]